jgi:gliding motility-associated-like protein
VYQNTSSIGAISFTKKFITINSNTLNVNSSDLDGDGKPDAVISKSGNPGDRIYILRNTSTVGNITFDTPDFLIVDGNIARRIEIEDLDNDGLPDIIVSNQANSRISIFKNNSTVGNISFEPLFTIEIQDTNEANIFMSGLSVRDLNGDGFPEIIAGRFLEKNVYIIPNQSQVGNLQFGPVEIIDVPGNLMNIVVGDINLDGKPDIVAAKLQQNQISVLLNDGSGGSISFQPEQTFVVNDRPWGLDLGDVNGDGNVDIIASSINYSDRKISILENQSTGGTLTLNVKYVPTPEITRNLKFGDVDNDGIPDFVLTSVETFNVTILRNENCFEPQISPEGPLSICAGTEINVQATRGINVTYQWDKDNIVFKTGPEDTIIINTPGVYKVVATSAGGSCVEVSNAIIANAGSGSVPTNPVIYNDGPFCQGGNILLSTDAVAGGTYLWTGPNGYTSTSQSVVIPDATAAMAGQYSLQVTVGDCSSEVSSTIVNINVLPSFNITLNGLNTVCIGDSALMTVNAVAGYTYQWYREGAEIAGETGSSIYAKSSGTYIVEVTQTSSGCITFSTNTITLTFIESPVASFEYNDPECTGSDIQFINTSTFEQGESVDYTWDFGDGSITVNNENPVYAYPGSGSFTIDFTVGYTSGACGNTVSVPIEINPQPVFTIIQTPDETLCEGEPVELSTSVVFDGYLWNTGATTQAITVRSPFEYYVTVTDANRCSATEFLTLDMLPRPVVVATATPPEVEEDAEVQLDASGAISYRWAPVANLDDPNIPNPIATVTETTLFVVQGLNADGCTDTTSVLVTVIETNTINVKPRNLFSPNGDGIDDFWVIENIERYPGSNITIYNGMGSVVYESNNYNNDWDAIYNGKELPETAYFFVIRYENKDPKTGSVTVVR